MNFPTELRTEVSAEHLSLLSSDFVTCESFMIHDFPLIIFRGAIHIQLIIFMGGQGFAAYGRNFVPPLLEVFLTPSLEPMICVCLSFIFCLVSSQL